MTITITPDKMDNDIITLRDIFAGLAMQGMYAGNVCTTDGDTGRYAHAAYQIADAMIEERKIGE